MSVNRGIAGALLDKLFGWYTSLPAETCSYAVERVRIPVASNTSLVADIYRPLLPKPLGTILVRSPYGIGVGLALGHARIFAARGYNVLLSSCRGTEGSDGEFRPGRDEREDGHAVIAWMRTQSWYTGSFATLGGSFLSYAQWAIMSDPPADMKAAIISAGPHDLGQYVLGTGALHADIVSWLAMMARMKQGSRLPPPLFFWWEKDKITKVLGSLPLLDAIRDYLQADVPPELEYMIQEQDLSKPFWTEMRQTIALERTNIPILLVAGWYDTMFSQMMQQYYRLAERGVNVALTIGPWSHLEAQGGEAKLETLQWLGQYLANGEEGATRKSRVRIFVTGANEWREMEQWPPATQSRELYLASGKRLSAMTTDSDGPDSTFVFDPADPTPSLGAAMMINMNGAKDDDSALASRPDVLTFTSEPLEQDMDVCGKTVVDLWHSTSHPFADLLVRLNDVDQKGSSHNIAETYLRLDPERGPWPLHLVLGDCGHRFLKGHKVRLTLAGSNHPRHIRNLGTGENVGTSTMLRPVTHTIRHGPSTLSKLTLPVVTSRD